MLLLKTLFPSFLVWRQAPRLDLSFFCEQIALFLEEGYTLPAAIIILADHLPAIVIRRLNDYLHQGRSPDRVLRLFPKLFPADFCDLLAVGYRSGQLPTILRQYARYRQEIQAISDQFWQALFYPSLVLIMGALLLIYTLYGIIPAFARIFADMGADIPKITVVLLSLSQILQLYGGPIALFIIVLIFINLQNHRLRSFWQSLISFFFWRFKIGKLFWLSRLFEVLGILLAVGIPLSTALENSITIIGNPRGRREFRRIARACLRGTSFCQACFQAHWPRADISLIAVMEKRGQLATGLTLGAKFMRAKLYKFLNQTVRLLEPLTLISVALVVGLIVMAIILPLFDLTNQLL